MDEYSHVLRQGIDASKDALQDFDLGKELTPAEMESLRKSTEKLDAVCLYFPTQFAPYLIAGKCYYILGSNQIAEDRLKQSLANIPANTKERPVLQTKAEANYVMSLIQFSKGDFDEALKQADLSLKLVTNSANYYVARARAHLQLSGKDNIAKAKVDIAIALKVDPTNVRAIRLAKLMVPPPAIKDIPPPE